MLKLSWLRLGEAVERLISRGLSAEEAKVQLTRAIASLQDLKPRLPERPPIPISSGFGWLATPELDFERSTVIAPCKGSDPREPTRRRAVIVEVRTEDIDRLWPDPLVTSSPAPPANDNLGSATRGPRPVKMEAVKADLLAKLRAGSLKPEELQGWKEAAGQAEYDVSRDTFRKARSAALSEFVETANSDN